MSSGNLTIDLSDLRLYNRKYLPLLHRPERIRVVYGGRGSGKSDFIAQDVLLETMNRPHSSVVLVRKVHARIKASQFKTIVEQIKRWGLMDLFKINRSSSDMSITYLPNGNDIITMGMDNPDKAKSLKDPTFAWYEEANEISYDDWRKTSLSIRTNRPGVKLREYLSFNPDQERCWINDVFFPEGNEYEREDGSHGYIASKRPNSIILHTTYRDNMFLNPETHLEMDVLRQTDPERYKVDGLGLWGRITDGLAFPKISTCEPGDVPSGEVIYGIDWGYFPDPVSVVKITRDGQRLYVEEKLRRLKLKKEELFDSLLWEVIENRHDYIYADQGRQEIIDDAYEKGFNIQLADKSRGTRNSSIATVQNYEIVIVKTGHHQDILREFRNYKRKKDRYGEWVPEWQDGDDHGVDAVKMAVHTHSHEFWRAAALVLPSLGKGEKNGAPIKRGFGRTPSNFSNY